MATPIATTLAGVKVDPMPITFTNTFHGRMRRYEQDGEGNMIVTADQVDGTGSPGLEMWQVQNSNTARTASAVFNDRQVITFDFGRPVTNLSFTISDIDASLSGNGYSQYRDAVVVSPAPTGQTRGAWVQGAGTSSDPWRSTRTPTVPGYTDSSGLNNSTASAGNVVLTYAGPVQTIAVSFYNAEQNAFDQSGSQAIYFSNFTFNANSCVSP